MRRNPPLLRLGASLAVAAGLVTAAPPSRADEKSDCVEASSQAQTLRDAHHLIEARDQLRSCARAECPAVVQKDCITWLEAVEQSLPTVVIAASDETGRDIFDVKVAVDGKPLASKLDGESKPLDPGPHTFHFEFPSGAALDQQVLVREGLKNQAVSVHLKPLASAAPPVGPGPGATAAPSASPWRTVGWVAGGAGLLGLGLGAIFGGVALSDKNGAHCDATSACDAGPLSSARGAATASTVGFVVGGVLLATGAALVLFTPSSTGTTGQVTLAPTLGAREGGAVLGARF